MSPANSFSSATPAENVPRHRDAPAAVKPAMKSDAFANLAQRLIGTFQSDKCYVIALSGGVDSSVVAKAAALSGASVCMATADSPAVSQVERDDVGVLVGLIGLPHQFIRTDEASVPGYQANTSQRCYYCKSALFEAMRRHFPDATIVTGTNADDLSDFRPGLRAAEEAAVFAPLATLAIGKSLVRQLASYWQLPVANKPASPCLASRIAHGVVVTPERLRMIESAEAVLRSYGIREFRVRLHADELARVEVPLTELDIVLEHRQQLVQRVMDCGFRFVTLDLAGFRSGSLNPIVTLSEIKRA